MVFACHETRVAGGVAGELKALALLGPVDCRVSEVFSARSERPLSLRTPPHLPQFLDRNANCSTPPRYQPIHIRLAASDVLGAPGCRSLLESASNKVMEGGRPGAYTLKMSSTVVLLLLGPPHSRQAACGQCRLWTLPASVQYIRKSADETGIHTVVTRSSSLPHQRPPSW